MAEAGRIKYLQVALQAVGVIFIVGIYSLVMVWPSGWSWHSGPSHHLPHYLQMILGVYATLGVFLLIASRDPLANLSLIWFTVWSTVVHAGIMAAQALANPDQIGHLWGDVPALLVVAGVLALLTPRRAEARTAPSLELGVRGVESRDRRTSSDRADTRALAGAQSKAGD